MKFKSSNFNYFILLCIGYAFFSYAYQILLVDDNIYLDYLTQNIEYIRALNLLNMMKSYGWVNYLLIPLIMPVKISCITSCISMGFYLLNDNLLFKNIFFCVTISEFSVFVSFLLKIIYFLFVKINYSYFDLINFHFYSLLDFLDLENVPVYLSRPLSLLNVVEISYWFLLSFSISKVIKIGYTESFKVVISSYGTGLLVWVLFTVFITITYS